ncbi:LOW QUALITY PROTEIN: isocitrate dehydrogenase [NAD] subunit gamma, mitochondrial, partial [Pelecanus crispus]|uniref:LOW QUALITY PROTEIN: isocitrate dehydrogenase [NAD] subunit gamma, mitochondrial n=1 Tax=Pelecanus crispus TaxID=36300 RepID=UPI003F5D12B4
MAAALAVARRLRLPAVLGPRPAWISHDAERRHLPPVSARRPPAKYGGRHTVTLIPGDGIGPELMLHVKEVFRHACVPVDFEEVRVSAEAPEDDVNNAIMAIRRNGVALKGNIETNHNLPPSHKSRNNLIRTSLDLYANVIHCQSLPGVETRHRDIDILIVRENTEGEYSSLEHEVGHAPPGHAPGSHAPPATPPAGQPKALPWGALVAGVVESLKIITAGRSRRIAHYAFRLARAAARRCVTAVHKANIMKLGDGLFLQCCQEVAAEYPEISFRSMIVDNTTMQLVSRPQQFDVMVMPNLYGNIVNNVCAGLVGGPGLVPGANYGHDYAVFETVGRGVAALLAACMMLDHLRLHSHASAIRQAVLASLDDPRTHTPDIGGQGTTSGAVQSIISHLLA